MENSKIAALEEALLKEQEKRQALESDFNKNKAEFDAIFQNLADAYLMIDLSGRVLKMNSSAKEMFGYDSQKEKFNLMQIVFPEDYDKITVSFQQLAKEGVLKGFRSNVKTKNNILKHVQANVSIVYDCNKKPIAAQGIVRDITEGHTNHTNLIKSEKRLTTLISNNNTGVILSDENCKVVLINDKISELFGVSIERASIENKEYLQIAEDTKMLFENSEAYVSRINTVLKDKKRIIGDELFMKNGQILERDFSPIIIDNKYQGHLWRFRNVTLKRRFDKNIEAEKFKYESIINNTSLGLVETTDFDTIKTINKRLLRMYNLTHDEVIGKRISDLFPNEKIGDLLKKIKFSVDNNKPTSFEFAFDSLSNGRRYWLIGVSPNYNINGRTVGFIGSHLDITNLKRLEVQKDKLLKELGKSNEELQDYAHMVSHDLKAPLRNIDTLISWFKEDYQDKLDVEGIEKLDVIRGTVEKMEHLIKGILVYSSLNYDKAELYNINLNKLVNEICTFLHIPENISVNIVGKLPIVNGDKYRFLQLFQNLIHNAIAYNDKPNVVVTISHEDVGDYWKFCIEDNGKGIEKKYLKKIFEVFQKIGNDIGSSGIGLSIVKKVVEVYDGKVYAESELGIGTKMFFTLKKF